MFNVNDVKSKLMNRFFRKVDNVVWDLMTGKIGIVTDEGIACIEGEGEDAEVSINLMDQFGIALPAFAQNTPVDQLKIGDLIFNDKKLLGWITALPTEKKKSFTLLTPDGTRRHWNPPKVNMIGLENSGGAMVLRSLINSLPDDGLGNMQNMLLPLLALGGDNMDLDSMLPVILFSQMNGDNGGNMGNMLMPMLMMSMAGGEGGMPFGKGQMLKKASKSGSNYFDQ